jgi:branched-chain amino acid transport system ATP-binding protein
MLRLHEVQVSVRGVAILRGVTLEVPEQTVVGLVGRNGAGKTTTLKVVMGLMPASSGSITLNGDDLRQVPPHRRAALGIGYLPEDRRLIPLLTVEENLLVPVWANRLADGMERLARVYEIMPLVQSFASRRAGQLSGGQQKLVALARAVMVGNRLLLLDEPFEGLAPALIEQIERALRRLLAEGVAILIAESELTHVGQLAGRMYMIERGEVARVPDDPGGAEDPPADHRSDVERPKP